MKAFLSKLVGLLFDLRSIWLNIVTFGAWSSLGNYAWDLGEQLGESIQKGDRLEYRLDRLMRHMEQNLEIVIPHDIEPPRLTAFGEGLSIQREAEMVRAADEQERRESGRVTCSGCAGRCTVMVDVEVNGEKHRVLQACPECKGAGKVDSPIPV